MNYHIGPLKLSEHSLEEVQKILFDWSLNNQMASYPPPDIIKRATLLRNFQGASVVVETGTHYGYTTLFLAHCFNEVISIELSEELYNSALKLLADHSNITLYKGASDEILAKILPLIGGDCAFYLDAHFSGGATTMHADTACPIISELQIIAEYMKCFQSCIIAIDDCRNFIEKSPGYPTLFELASHIESLDMKWTIENDIFIAKTCQHV
jgi:hypothetical protein